MNGIDVTVVGFFGGNARTPVWFRLWIDNAGLVRRAEMRAPGHFMDQDFSGFDAPSSIVAPSPVVSPSGSGVP